MILILGIYLEKNKISILQPIQTQPIRAIDKGKYLEGNICRRQNRRAQRTNIFELGHLATSLTGGTILATIGRMSANFASML